MLTGKAWKITAEKNSSDCVYQMQVDGVTPGVRNRVEKALNGWDIIGEGTKKGKEILIFSRNFKKQNAWLKWAKEFAHFKLVELDKNGDPKKYVKIGLRSGQGLTDKSVAGKRKCGKCGQPGHNARTCKGEVALSAPEPAPVAKKAGKYKCGKCGELGHNARSCGAKVSNKKSEIQLSAKKKAGKYKCGKCGEFGHNARTCGK